MFVLGIETSCDETAAAVVKDGNELLSNEVASSMDLHSAFGGVIPEIAARCQLETINHVIDQSLLGAFPNISTPANRWAKIDAIAVTYGAGLGGSLLVGVMTAKSIAISQNKPLYAVNHVLGHLYANFITKTNLEGYHLPPKQPQFPMLGLIVSGGHSQLAYFENHFKYQLLGQTVDDAVGEAFDKVAKILGLPYPGGPSIARVAKNGKSLAHKLPISKLQGQYDFSFSGLKTAVLRLVQQLAGVPIDYPSNQLADKLNDQHKADIAASFQYTALKTIVDKTHRAYLDSNPKSVIIGGGVAANSQLRMQLADKFGGPVNSNKILHYTDPKLCTDNGAMVAALGNYMAVCGQPPADPFKLSIAPDLVM